MTSISSSTESTHERPAWRDKANFVIGANLEESGRTEQLWARQISDVQFEICCIPFFLYDLALGDVVETDERYTFVRVVREAGRAVFRVWFGDSAYSKEEIEKQVLGLGGLVEWSSENLMAVDALDGETADRIFDYLRDHHDQGHLQVEIGKWTGR
jgi:hypothetical protein